MFKKDDLEQFVRKNKTYRLESWLRVYQMHTLGVLVFLFCAYLTENVLLVGLSVISMLIVVWASNRYAVEWARIARQHPKWR